MFQGRIIMMVGVAMVMVLIPLVYAQYQVQPVGIPWDCDVCDPVNGCLIIRLHAQLDHEGFDCVQQCCNFPRRRFVQRVEPTVDVVMVVAAQSDSLVETGVAKDLDHCAMGHGLPHGVLATTGVLALPASTCVHESPRVAGVPSLASLTIKGGKLLMELDCEVGKTT